MGDKEIFDYIVSNNVVIACGGKSESKLLFEMVQKWNVNWYEEVGNKLEEKHFDIRLYEEGFGIELRDGEYVLWSDRYWMMDFEYVWTFEKLMEIYNGVTLLPTNTNVKKPNFDISEDDIYELPLYCLSAKQRLKFLYRQYDKYQTSELRVSCNYFEGVHFIKVLTNGTFEHFIKRRIDKLEGYNNSCKKSRFVMEQLEEFVITNKPQPLYNEFTDENGEKYCLNIWADTEYLIKDFKSWYDLY